MEARQELRFYMEPYTPETLPLGRLAEYLARLAKVVGDHRAVHLIELQEGSTVFVNRADPEAIPAIYERVAGVKRGDAPRDAMEAYNALNTLLEQDNGTGALLEPGGAQILDFPDRRAERLVFSWVEQRGEVDGEVARIGGTGRSGSDLAANAGMARRAVATLGDRSQAARSASFRAGSLGRNRVLDSYASGPMGPQPL
jgi:hypothetical protein